MYVALHVAGVGCAAFVFGLVGAEQACIDVRRDDVTQLSTVTAQHGIISFGIGVWVVGGLLAALAAGLLWIRLWRSRLQLAFSALLLVTACVLLVSFALDGTARHGGLLTPDFFTESDDAELRLMVLLIVLDAVLVAVALLVVVERAVVNQYAEELDAAMFSHLRLHESIEMLLVREGGVTSYAIRHR